MKMKEVMRAMSLVIDGGKVRNGVPKAAYHIEGREVAFFIECSLRLD